jgi:hypothetical protein
MIVDHGKKHQPRDKVIIKTQRGKTAVLHKDGKWTPYGQKPRSFRQEENQ